MSGRSSMAAASNQSDILFFAQQPGMKELATKDPVAFQDAYHQALDRARDAGFWLSGGNVSTPEALQLPAINIDKGKLGFDPAFHVQRSLVANKMMESIRAASPIPMTSAQVSERLLQQSGDLDKIRSILKTDFKLLF